MIPEWLQIVPILIVVSLLVVVVAWRRLKIRPGRGLLFFMLLTLLLSVEYPLWMRSDWLPSLDLFQQNLWQSVVILTGTITAIQFVKWMLIDLIVARHRIKFPPFFLDIIGWTIIIFVILFTLRQQFNVELTGLLVTSTVASAIIGFSLQDTLGNIVAGISLQIEGAFNVSDWVEIDGVEGQVVSQNWRTLTLQTRDDHRVMLTNSNVARSKIINYSRPTNGQIQTMQIVLSEAHSPNLVKSLLIQAVNDIQGVELHPRLQAHVVSFQEGTITYGLSYWLNDYSDKVIVQDQVMTRLWFALHRANIHIPEPSGKFVVQLASDETAVEQHHAEQSKILKALERLEWLDALDERQLAELAAGAVLALYTTDETLVTQGEAGDSLFIVVSGSVAVYFDMENGRSLFATNLYAGDFFGEMSLLTGEARNATVRAGEDTEILLIKHDEFAKVLKRDPSILELFVDSLEKRKANYQQRVEADLSERAQRNGHTQNDFLQRIRRYLRVPG